MSLTRARSRQKFFPTCIAFIAFCGLYGCGGKPFNVKPRTEVPPASYGSKAEAGGAGVEATAIRDEDVLFETFDANLIMAGVLPVRVKITNTGAGPLVLKKAAFEIKAPDGRKFKSLDARRAYKRLISYYEISVYTKGAYKESQEDFSSHALDTATAIEAGQSRDGLLFFSVPAEVARAPGLRLVARRVNSGRSKNDAPVELDLN